MRYLLPHILLLAVFVFTAFPIAGQSFSPVRLSVSPVDSLRQHISREMSASASFRFTYPQGSSVILPGLQGNALELERLSAFISQALSYPEYSVSRICLTSYCSIEGDYSRNEALSRDRVEQFYLYLRECYPALYRFPHNLAWVAEDWAGLSQLVRDSDLGERDEVLSIIHKVRVYDDRELLLVKLNGGQVFRRMERTFFPRLRRVELRIEYRLASHAVVEDVPADPLIYNVLEKEPLPDLHHNRSLALAGERMMRQGWEYYVKPAPDVPSCRFALKTNLLLWAGVQHDLRHTAPVANAALEYRIDAAWAVEFGAMYSYWHYRSNRLFQGLSGYRIEPRYYVPVSGKGIEAYVGLYGRFGDYDLRDAVESYDSGDNTVRASLNYTGDYWDAGLSSGVFIKLAGGLGLEAGARAGYLRTNAIGYTVDTRYNLYHSEKKYNRIKITDVGLNLVYRFK